MAQDFSLRYPLLMVKKLRSVDGDNAAAMRYTEARIAKISMSLFGKILKKKLDFGPNFDESLDSQKYYQHDYLGCF